MQSNNPLAGYFRQPKHYLTLPSNGRWYAPNSLDWPASGELAVFPMTARDEITLKTPDALLNGQSIVDVIQSCMPAIKDGWSIPTVDLDAILIAIRIATYGDKMDISPSCPKCQAVNNYQTELKEALAQCLGKKWTDMIEVSGLKIRIRPLSYRQLSVKQLRTFEEQRLLEEIRRSDLGDDEKLKRFNEGFKKLTGLTLELVLDSIEYIETPDNNRVQDRNFIEEFLKNTSKEVFDVINDLVKSNRENFGFDQIVYNDSFLV